MERHEFGSLARGAAPSFGDELRERARIHAMQRHANDFELFDRVFAPANIERLRPLLRARADAGHTFASLLHNEYVPSGKRARINRDESLLFQVCDTDDDEDDGEAYELMERFAARCCARARFSRELWATLVSVVHARFGGELAVDSAPPPGLEVAWGARPALSDAERARDARQRRTRYDRFVRVLAFTRARATVSAAAVAAAAQTSGKRQRA